MSDHQAITCGARTAVVEALISTRLAGCRCAGWEDITVALWGTRVSPSTASDPNKKIYATIEG